jgi:hypothetical protein
LKELFGFALYLTLIASFGFSVQLVADNFGGVLHGKSKHILLFIVGLSLLLVAYLIANYIVALFG